MIENWTGLIIAIANTVFVCWLIRIGMNEEAKATHLSAANQRLLTENFRLRTHNFELREKLKAIASAARDIVEMSDSANDNE